MLISRSSNCLLGFTLRWSGLAGPLHVPHGFFHRQQAAAIPEITERSDGCKSFEIRQFATAGKRPTMAANPVGPCFRAKVTTSAGRAGDA